MSNKWFDIPIQLSSTKEKPSIYALQEPGHSEEVISYLVLGFENGVLDDTGMGIGNIKKVVDQFTSSSIKVINTHSHWDHIGGNHLFQEIGIHHAEAKNLNLGVSNSFLKTQMEKKNLKRSLPFNFNLDDNSIPPCKPTRLLQDGDNYNLNDYTLEVIHTPGHSPGSICLWNNDKGHLFTGDCIYQGPLFAHLPGSNLQDYFLSIKKLSKLLGAVETIFPAHNQCPLDHSFLEEVVEGFERIENGSASFMEHEMYDSHVFSRFQVLVPKC
ncbi:MAG: MBL fold metallo-hydrolase [Candidatus Hodarchaeota archaeon]